MKSLPCMKAYLHHYEDKLKAYFNPLFNTVSLSGLQQDALRRFGDGAYCQLFSRVEWVSAVMLVKKPMVDLNLWAPLMALLVVLL